MNTSFVPAKEGVNLRFFMLENARHDGKLLYEWLLDLAKREGLSGGSVTRAIAGFGRHGVIHEEAFFELAGKLPVTVEFIMQPERAERLLDLVQKAGAELVYTVTDIRYGVLEGADNTR